MKKGEGLTYASVGVSYAAMDPFKRAAQRAAMATNRHAEQSQLTVVDWTRGESVLLFYDTVRQCYWGHVHEGLGTKNLVADAMAQLTGKVYYYGIATDTLAMGFNDAATLGVRPTSVTMHLSVGSSAWFDDQQRSQALIDGWAVACHKVQCTWAGGETPTLKGILLPEASELSCSVWGIIEPVEQLIQGNIEHGDAIVLLGSSGIHANGLTLAREIALKLSNGYATELETGQPYGEALLEPTVLYGPLIEECISKGVDIHYGVNITGHGWRKLMRSPKPFHYVIERVPEPLPIFRFLQEHGRMSDENMYGDLNMGAGFALYVPPKDVSTVIDLARGRDIPAWEAGYIDGGLHARQHSDERRVIIEPLQLAWSGETLGVR